MRYTSAKNQVRHGAVWSPGPVANSLWLIDDEAGEPVAVKVPRGDVSAAHEFNYALPRIEEKGRGLVWKRATRQRGRDGWADIFIPTEDYRDAPKLPERVWRAAVGDQCQQLELTAA